MKKILAVASGGGHWTELMRLREAFNEHEVVFVGVKPFYRSDVDPHRFYMVSDVSRLYNRISIPLLIGKLLFILIKERPAIVITTGALPGMCALLLGKMLGTGTVWIDSIANVEEISLSGRMAKKFADLWLTQWPHLADSDGPTYQGSVL
ncbi:UDP-N-acetylglucosamine--LPS N-acetylglucosamine transferase [Methylobacter sp.]|uniref:UDP-N-acetylglucosamine--LPS N-acetylglucosamine transferase n=1 Tax=Methylobacter sp. TaxID=2051955 RepID=UPI002FDE0D1F